MRDIARRAILAIGFAWGAVTFLVGLAGSFVLNSIHLFSNLVGLFSVLSILPITIAAVWRPKTSAALLVLSFLLLEYGALGVEGYHTVLQVALKLGLPTILLACGYLYTASVRAKSQARTDKSSS
jgi:hypothetical protein